MGEEAEEFVGGVGTAGSDEGAEVLGIGVFIDGIETFADFGLRQIQGSKTRLDLKTPPRLIFHFVMDVSMAETGIVQEVV